MINVYDVMKQRLEDNQESIMVTVLSGPRQGDKILYDERGTLLFGQALDGITIPGTPLNQLHVFDGIECFLQPIEKDPEVLILGAGHVSRCVADALLQIGVHVTVADDRREYLKPEFFRDEVKKVHIDFNHLADFLPLRSYQGIIVVTRAHEYDSISLHQLRSLLPMYIGVMGSSKRIHHAFEALLEEGWSQEELDMLYGPIGLDLGAQTPEEIAVSIVAEYLAVIRGKNGMMLSKRRKDVEGL